MDNQASKAGWDVFLFGVPLLAFLIFGFFRLDEVFTSHKKEAPPSPPVPSSDKPTDIYGEAWRSDPDGRPWDEP